MSAPANSDAADESQVQVAVVVGEGAPVASAAAAAPAAVSLPLDAAVRGDAKVDPPAAASSTPHAAAPSVPENGKAASPDAKQAPGHREYDADDHMLNLPQLVARYGCDVDEAHPEHSKGLTAAQVEASRAQHGRNVLSPPKDIPEILKFLHGFLDGFMVLLNIAGWLCVLASGLSGWDRTNLTLAIVLFVVVILTVIMNYFQERQSNAVLASVRKMLADKCTVVREGREQTIDPADLVPGDVVRVVNGGRVPADMRMIATNELKVECSSLTGENDSIAIGVDKKHDLPLESRNIIFNSSLVVNGEGHGIVIRTGDHTMIGSIAGLASATAVQVSNLELEVRRFVRLIFVFGLVTAIIFFIIGASRKPRELVPVFVNAFVVVIVANVPEGLPATVVSCLTVTAKRMAARNVLVKQSRIIEALGAASVICSDKTGTLTQNKMTVENMWFNRSFANVRGGAAAIRRAVNLGDSSNLSTIGRRAPYGLAGTIGRARGVSGQTAPAIPAAMITTAPVDIAYQMTVGRSARPDPSGTGRLEIAAAAAAGTGAANDAIARSESMYYGSFSSFGTFVGSTMLKHVSWSKANPYMRLVMMAGICNRAREEEDNREGAHTAVKVPMAGGQEKKLTGDASDRGLYSFVDSVVPVAMLRMSMPAVFEIPFNSVNKWSYAIVRDPEAPTRTHIGLMKGAPEIILTKCTHYLFNGAVRPIDDEFKDDMNAAYTRFGFSGERVLGFAYKPFDARPADVYRTDETSYPREGLVFLGLISLVDPPRDGVDDAVARCRGASIRVTMVTGDHPLTAEAIARKVGIITLPTAREVAAEDGVPENEIPLTDPRVRAVVRPGASIRNLTREQWDAILTKDEVVFARTSPQQKLEIVENYQRLGHVVAVTGDGVNDSPALKQANIGVSMGTGDASEVAKEAADILLMDNNFASIVNAIEEGRVLFDNLKKSIAYTLAHLWPELWPIFLNIAFSFPLGLPGLIILVIDLITEQGPAISYAYEAAESSVMLLPPRDIKRDRLVTRQLLTYSYAIAGLAESVTAMFAFFMVFVAAGVPVSALAFAGDTYFVAGAPDFVAGGRVWSADAQQALYAESVSAWFATIVCCQFWHTFVCKTRFVSVFQHDMFANITTLGGVFIAVVVMLACVYIPFLNFVLQNGPLRGAIWPVHLVFALYIVGYTEYSKYITRKYPDGWWAENIAW